MMTIIPLAIFINHFNIVTFVFISSHSFYQQKCSQYYLCILIVVNLLHSSFSLISISSCCCFVQLWLKNYFSLMLCFVRAHISNKNKYIPKQRDLAERIFHDQHFRRIQIWNIFILFSFSLYESLKYQVGNDWCEKREIPSKRNDDHCQLFYFDFWLVVGATAAGVSVAPGPFFDFMTIATIRCSSMRKARMILKQNEIESWSMNRTICSHCLTEVERI